MKIGAMYKRAVGKRKIVRKQIIASKFQFENWFAACTVLRRMAAMSKRGGLYASED
jgi:hypothetical protein